MSWISASETAAPRAHLTHEAATLTNQTVEALAAFFGYSLAAALCIAVVAAAVTHFLQPVAGKVNQYWTTRRWLLGRARTRLAAPNPDKTPGWLWEALERELSEEELDVIFHEVKWSYTVEQFGVTGWFSLLPYHLRRFGLSRMSSVLRDELFMHMVQAQVREAVARPSRNPQLYAVATAYAPADARAALAAFDLVATRSPETAAILSDFESRDVVRKSEKDSEVAAVDASTESEDRDKGAPNPTAVALSVAENLVKAATDRALDELQLRLLSGAVITHRLFAVAVGILLAMWAQTILALGLDGLFIAVGAAGGALSLFISDFASSRFARSASVK